jgi:hypothetical protein
LSTAPLKTRPSNVPGRHAYDVAVVGGQLAGAIAATLLARRGMKVLYVEHDGTGTGYQHEGWLLPYAPCVFPAFKSVGVLEEVLEELGLNTEAHRTLKVPAPNLQLLLGEARIDLSPDATRRAKELQRALGEKGAAFDTALKATVGIAPEQEPFFKADPPLPPDGMWQKWSTNRLAGKHPALEAEVALSTEGAQGLTRSLGKFLHWSQSAEQLAASRPLSLALAAINLWPNGREGLRDFFLDRLAALGGDVLAHDASSVVEQIAFDGSAAVGIKLLKRDTLYRADAIIGATDGAALRRLLPDKKRHRGVSDALEMPVTKRFLFTLNLVLPEKALPRGLGEVALLSGQDAELSPALLQVMPARKVGAEKPEAEMRVLTAAAFVDAATRELGEDTLRAIAARLKVELDRVMPFSLGKAVLTSCPYLDASGVRGSRLSPHPLLGFEEAQFLGVAGLPAQLPGKGFYLASREVLPGLGLEGEVLAARRVAKMIQDTLKKANPLSKV